jgi:hypothetical protein
MKRLATFLSRACPKSVAAGVKDADGSLRRIRPTGRVITGRSHREQKPEQERAYGGYETANFAHRYSRSLSRQHDLATVKGLDE